MTVLTEQFKEFKHYSYLLSVLVKRNIKKKYKGSVLGIVWSLLNPLLNMIVLTIVFSALFNRSIENYPVYLITGRLVFSFFTESTNTAMKSIITSASLIKKVYIPKYIIILSNILSSFIIFCISLIDLFLVVIVTKAPITPTILLVPIYLILLLMFVIGVGLILSTIATFFRDMTHLYGVITLVLMYLSAIFYPVEILPDYALRLLVLNPMFFFIKGFRNCVYYNVPLDMMNLLYCVIVAVVALILGIIVFKKNQDKFIFVV